MKLSIVLAAFSLFFSIPVFASSEHCASDKDCLYGYQKCVGGKCVWLKTDDQKLFLLGAQSALEQNSNSNCLEESDLNVLVNIPERDCYTCIVKLNGSTICKDDGKPVGNRGCINTIYE